VSKRGRVVVSLNPGIAAIVIGLSSDLCPGQGQSGSRLSMMVFALIIASIGLFVLMALRWLKLDEEQVWVQERMLGQIVTRVRRRNG
jgi:hypothetical protein